MPLKDKIREQINISCAENGSDTPDYILAEYLIDCLAAFDKAVLARTKHYGKEVSIPKQDLCVFCARLSEEQIAREGALIPVCTACANVAKRLYCIK